MKKLIILALLLVVISTAFASVSYSPSVQGYIGGTFLHPTSKYLKTVQGKDSPFFRTSASAGFDALFVNFKFNKFELGGGMSFLWTSQSLAAGISVLQPYTGVGVVVGGERRFETGFGIGAKLRLMFCKNRVKYKFDTMDLEVNPSYKFYDAKNFEISVITPVDFTYRNDSFSVRLHVGFDLQYNVLFGSNKGGTDEK